jgi:hypothetical protein
MAISTQELQSVFWHGNITLAVSTTGSDVQSANRPYKITKGDYSAYPFATIQAAINALPIIDQERISSGNADATINVGPGTFTGFKLVGSVVSVRFNGTRQTAVLASGPSTGTATSGTDRTLTLTGAGWTVDDLVGRYVNITAGPSAGNIYLIAKNTTDTITIPAYMSPAIGVGSVFIIEDLVTILNATPAPFTGIANFQGNIGYNRFIDFKLVSPGGTVAGVFASSNPGTVSAQRISTIGCYVGFSQSSGGIVWTESCYAEGSAYSGFSCQNVIMFVPYRCLARNCNTGYAYNNGCGWVYFGAGSGNMAINCPAGATFEGVQGILNRLICEGCGTGLYALRCVLRAIGCSIDGSTSTPIFLAQTNIEFDGWLTGSGNVGFGLNANGGNYVELSGITPTITGTLGDVTVDGFTDETWAALSSVGDYALDLATGARINRR